MEIRYRLIWDYNIKRTLFEHEKMKNTNLQEFRKDSKIFMKQERGKRVKNRKKLQIS